MTAATMTDSPAIFTPRSEYKLSGIGLLRSEWTKFWSLRSSWIVLLCAAVFAAGIGLAVAATYSNVGDQGSIPADLRAEAALGTTMFGVALSSMFVAVLGVLAITGEYSTGSIRSTMSAAPKRLSVLWAKAAVFGAVVIVMYTAMVFVTFFAANALLSGTDLAGVSLGDENVVRALFGYVAMVAYLGLLGLGIGAILRNSAGSIGFYVGVIMILPNLATLLPWNWVSDVVPYTPGNVVNSIAYIDTSGLDLSYGESWLWMGIWLLVTYGLAAFMLKRRDV
ncbi:ABC transporter permease subunit [Glycomyces buryatensis]|uniref:ABC transporter permease n=1 Tax=Glycomyces buryatensis TaxID=2570927 RepID=A0A4S8PQW1_9ACTN|nr:ABC transporter permease subunit [Glycomyces buryatensis]THV33527.1 ABC transporter permease [Glycomyces buryatensis]